MKYEELYHALAHYQVPSRSLWDELCTHVETRAYRAQETWIRAGDIPKNIGMILSGGILSYRLRDERHHLEQIWENGQLIFLWESGWVGRKSMTTLLFPMPSEVLEIPIAELIRMRSASEEMHQFVDHLHASDIQRLKDEIEWRTKRKGYEKVKIFNEHYPKMTHYLPEEKKANFLGMSRRSYNDHKNKR